MGSKQTRVQADAGDPVRYETPVLSRRQAAISNPSISEQELTRFLARDFHVVVDRLARLLGQFKLDGVTSLLLPN